MWNFLNSSALWWLAAALPTITVLYFLKLRRTDHMVSSTLLWKRSVHDLRVNAPIQMIRRNLLLLLQLLIAAAIIIALARPFTKLTRSQGRRAAVVIDASASMATTDEEEGKSRFEAAKAYALSLVDDLGVKGEGADADDQLCVILAADRAKLVCGLTADKDRLRRAIQSLQRPRASVTNMKEALEMAIAVTNVARARKLLEEGGDIRKADRPAGGDEEYIGLSSKTPSLEANVIILSDGAFDPIPQRLADKLAGEVKDEAVGEGSRYVPFGKTESDNIAIVAADLRADPAGLTDRQLYVRLENQGRGTKTVSVEVTLEGEFLDRKSVTIPGLEPAGDGEDGQTFLPGSAGARFDIDSEAHGAIRIAVDADDSLATDNVVHAVIRPTEPIQALLVTEGNYFIRKALDADRDNLVYDEMRPVDYPQQGMPKTRSSKPYEIILYDRWAPPELPTCASFYVDCIPPLPDITEDKENSPLYAPLVLDWKRSHPLMRNLSLMDHIAPLKCRRFLLEGAWATVMDGQGLLLESEADLQNEEKIKAAREMDAPLLGCYITGERRAAVLAFDIYETTQRWPLRVSFPLFFRNVTHWLARPGGLQRAQLYRTGETLRVEYDEPVAEASTKVILPSGETRLLSQAGPRTLYFADTHETGIYTVAAPQKKERAFAFNLLSSHESANAARDTIHLGRELLRSQKGPVEMNTDLWPYLVMAVLAFLVLEWFVYNRRILG